MLEVEPKTNDDERMEETQFLNFAESRRDWKSAARSSTNDRVLRNWYANPMGKCFERCHGAKLISL